MGTLGGSGTISDVTRREVHDFIRSDIARLMAFPDAAMTDSVAADAYLTMMRAPRATDNSATAPVERKLELQITPDVGARLYLSALEPRPLVVYFHGGGWVTGDLDLHDLTCREIARLAGVQVLNVDYRLAPEHPYPAALDDAMAALRWAALHARQYHIDVDRLIIAGSSAGANLAAAATLRARDEDGVPEFAGQLLIYPVLDSSMATNSYEAFGEGWFLTRNQMNWFWEQYLSGGAEKTDPYVSPMQAESLRGVPPAIVVTAGCDPLHDEGLAYVERLRHEASGAILIDVPGQVHGFMSMPTVFSDASAVLEQVAEALTRLVDNADND